MENPMSDLMTRKQIAEMVGMSLNVVDDAVHEGHLKSFLIGRKRRATVQAVHAWIKYLMAQSAAGQPVKYRARGNRHEKTPR